MRQILRLNKALKVIVMSGDLMILNVVFIMLYNVFREQFRGSTFIYHPLPLVLVLLNLCYLICNLQSGIILLERIVRIEQILWKVTHDTFIFATLSICVLAFYSFEHLSPHFFLLFYFSLTACLACYRLFVRSLVKQLREQGKRCVE